MISPHKYTENRLEMMVVTHMMPFPPSQDAYFGRCPHSKGVALTGTPLRLPTVKMSVKYSSPNVLTHWGRVICIRVSELCQHWFGRVACSVLSHYLNQWQYIVNWTFKSQFLWNLNPNVPNFHSRKCIWKCPSYRPSWPSLRVLTCHLISANILMDAYGYLKHPGKANIW